MTTVNILLNMKDMKKFQIITKIAMKKFGSVPRPYLPCGNSRTLTTSTVHSSSLSPLHSSSLSPLHPWFVTGFTLLR